MAINPSTVSGDSVKLVGPAGELETTLISYDNATGNTSYDVSRNWSYLDNGQYSLVSGDSSGATQDMSTNRVVSSQLQTTMDINIDTPTDTTPPTITFVSQSHTTITAPGPQVVNFVVQFADAE